jgi:hypothetical protein
MRAICPAHLILLALITLTILGQVITQRETILRSNIGDIEEEMIIVLVGIQKDKEEMQMSKGKHVFTKAFNDTVIMKQRSFTTSCVQRKHSREEYVVPVHYLSATKNARLVHVAQDPAYYLASLCEASKGSL